MEHINKNYKTVAIKNYIKKNSFFIFFFTTQRNVNDWIVDKQKLKSIGFNVFEVFKNTTKKTLKKSIYINFKVLSSQALILLKSENHLFAFLLVCSFEFLSLHMLAIKLNNKINNKIQLKNNYSFHYTSNKLLIFQFYVANFKRKSK